jgi:hypothetical protein
MQRTVGTILTVVGVVGMVYFGYQYFQDSESFSVFGADVAVSTGDIVPVILSLVIFIGGLLVVKSSK